MHGVHDDHQANLRQWIAALPYLVSPPYEEEVRKWPSPWVTTRWPSDKGGFPSRQGGSHKGAPLRRMIPESSQAAPSPGRLSQYCN